MIDGHKTERYNDPNTCIEGQVYTDFYPGRPTYGRSPDVDEIEHPVIIALDQPISVEGTALANGWEYETPRQHVDRIQIATSYVDELRTLKGHGVRIKGPLFPAHTGHHHTDILISADDLPVAIDARNTFPDKTLIGSGSGFFIGHGGFVGTAAHVLADAEHFSVTRGLFRQKASVVAIDENLDLAVLEITQNGTLCDLVRKREGKVRPIRTWMAPRLGERVYTFGFPLGGTLPHSLNMTEGLISSEIGFEGHQFQISAAIQNGNSGGPVFDEFGNLIGIAVSSLEPGQTLNFCVQAQHFSSFCHSNQIALNHDELSEVKINPRSLAEAALHFCLEVESWL